MKAIQAAKFLARKALEDSTAANTKGLIFNHPPPRNNMEIPKNTRYSQRKQLREYKMTQNDSL